LLAEKVCDQLMSAGQQPIASWKTANEWLSAFSLEKVSNRSDLRAQWKLQVTVALARTQDIVSTRKSFSGAISPCRTPEVVECRTVAGGHNRLTSRSSVQALTCCECEDGGGVSRRAWSEYWFDATTRL